MRKSMKKRTTLEALQVLITPNKRMFIPVRFPILVDLRNAVPSSGGGGYLSAVRGTGTCHFLGVLFSKPLRNHGYHFHNFLTYHGIMGVLFRGFFIISRIMAQIPIQFVELWP